ncbi:hypothetical protein K488DRAFT_74612 [Vararia minispora EC-137]|uniref:Uncharacterized protein n=1 Tax=Vararia minispora EC-137 TaxID=1314806 RepID=A0ACB8Q6R6_9AGAM|nr:hypothetical protein K488DRAFT_74612 [Vararia minispora EC-137]
MLTPEVDVYAFAIVCVEILNRGGVPWPHADDEAVRHFVLDEDKRPNLPLVTGPLYTILQAAWARDPRARPPFARIARELKVLRERSGTVVAESPRRAPLSVVLDEEAHRRHAASPSMRPRELPEAQDDLVVRTSSSDDTYLAAESDFDSSTTTTASISGRSTVHADDALDDLAGSVPSIRTLRSSISSGSMPDDIAPLEDSVSASEYLPPLEHTGRATSIMNERRYRLLLQHDFHTTLTLPLWSPSPVRLGAVGYLSKPEGRFVTLLNCIDGSDAADRRALPFPRLSELGKVDTFAVRNEKRSAAQRGMDMVRNLFRGSGDRGARSNVSCTHAYRLRAGHKAAYLYAESTVYRYMEDINVLKAWFVANIDQIMAVHGPAHNLVREDVFLIVGVLEAQDYAMFVSHQHLDGQMNFNVFVSARPGEPWGAFTPIPEKRAGEPQDEDLGPMSMQWASKVSTVRAGNGRDAVLLSRLRFKADATEPTLL